MKKSLLALILASALSALAGCSSKAFYGGMIGAGVGGLNGNATSCLLFGAGIGGMIDAMDED